MRIKWLKGVIMKQTVVKTMDGKEATWSYQMKLIMLHTDFISAQWEPDSIGVEVMHHKDCIKVGMHPVRGNSNYQSFYFDIRYFGEILTFFRSLGFPCPTPDIFGYHKTKENDKK